MGKSTIDGQFSIAMLNYQRLGDIGYTKWCRMGCESGDWTRDFSVLPTWGRSRPIFLVVGPILGGHPISGTGEPMGGRNLFLRVAVQVWSTLKACDVKVCLCMQMWLTLYYAYTIKYLIMMNHVLIQSTISTYISLALRVVLNCMFFFSSLITLWYIAMV